MLRLWVFTLYVTRKRPPIQVALALIVMCAVVIIPGVGFAVVLYPAFHGGHFRQVNYLGIYCFGLLTFGGGSGLVFYVLCVRLVRSKRSNNSARCASISEDLAFRPGASAQESTAAAVSGSPESAFEPVAEPAPCDAPDESNNSTGMQSSTPESTFPDELRKHVVYVHVSGHYIEVVTTDGTEVLLMRLSDVARALNGEGMQTHRSYWVAYRHIVRLEKIDRRAVLHVTGGHKVPVSRSLRSEVLAFMKQRERALL